MLKALADTVTAAPWWLLTLAVIGAIAIVTVIVTLFLALGDRPDRLDVREAAPIDSDEFLPALGAAVGASVARGGTIEGLENGREILPAILSAIRGARETVHFLVYIWEPGEVSEAIWAALIERARAGVEVRLLLDGIGGFNVEEDRVRELEEAGGAVARFRPPRFGKLTRLHRRNHRRAIVIDGTVGFTGGWAVGDEWRGDGKAPEEWRESMYRVTGPMARSLQSAFALSWTPASGEILSGAAVYPLETEPLGDGLAHISLVSSPTDEAHPMRKAFFLTMSSTGERLWIANSYFVPDAHLRNVLRERARAGVDVRILLPNHHTDMQSVRYASRSYYDELLSDGIRIYEYQPSHMHRKVLVADGVWSIVGSANLDIRSKELNEENILGVMDHEFARSLEQTFLDDIEYAAEIDLEAWRGRGVWDRIKERFFVLFAEQM